jgi:hypothetical protein
MITKTLSKFAKNYIRIMERFEKKHPILNTLIVAVGAVFIWRGIWGLLDIYFFPNNQVLSYALSAVIGFLILVLDDFKIDEV